MIKYKNIYYMLAYAFDVLNQKGYEEVAGEEFDNIADLFSQILVKGMSIQIKRGLAKEYIEIEEEPLTIKGKINISDSIKRMSLQKGKASCTYDELSENSYMNQIIKTTLSYLLKSDASLKSKKDIKKILIYLNNVDIIPLSQFNWKLNFNKNNQTYKMLLSICYFVIKGMIQHENEGNIKVLKFIDEQRMSRLYEKFILEFYKKERTDLQPQAKKINWALDDDVSEFLPEMKSDITLERDNKILIIDAKYYENHSMQSYFDREKLISGNMYQIFTYVKNKQEEDKSKIVSGMLLYAKTDEEIYPNKTYNMSGNKISANVLDLNQDFKYIKKALLDIANLYF